MTVQQVRKLTRVLRVVTVEQAETLVEYGYGTPRKIRTLSKADLVRLPGIGGATADAIIAVLG